MVGWHCTTGWSRLNYKGSGRVKRRLLQGNKIDVESKQRRHSALSVALGSGSFSRASRWAVLGQERCGRLVNSKGRIRARRRCTGSRQAGIQRGNRLRHHRQLHHAGTPEAAQWKNGSCLGGRGRSRRDLHHQQSILNGVAAAFGEAATISRNRQGRLVHIARGERKNSGRPTRISGRTGAALDRKKSGERATTVTCKPGTMASTPSKHLTPARYHSARSSHEYVSGCRVRFACAKISTASH